MKITETCILEDRGIIYIEGPDTKEFLQNIITNNLDKISDKQSIYSSLLTPQGKYLFDFILGHRNYMDLLFQTIYSFLCIGQLFTLTKVFI